MKEKIFLIIFIAILFLSGSGFYLYARLKLPQNCRQFLDEQTFVFSDVDSSVNTTFNALIKTHTCMEKQNISLLHSSKILIQYKSAIQKTEEFLTHMHQQNVFCALSCGIASNAYVINDLLMFEELAQEVLLNKKPYHYHTKFTSLCSSNSSDNQVKKCMKEKILLKLQENIKPDNFNEVKNSFDTLLSHWQDFYSEILSKQDVPQQMFGIYTLVWVALNDMIKRHNIE